MQLARFVRTSGLLLMLGLAGFVGGCGSGSLPPAEQQKANEVGRESRKKAHQELSTEIQKRQEIPRRGGRRGPG